MSTNKFKENTTFEKRCEYSAAIKKNYPTMVPIILYTSSTDKTVKLTRSKYLAPQDISFSKFAANVRAYTNINETQSMFLFVNNKIPGHDTLLGEIYNRHKSDDGFLYITVSIENSFGGWI